MRPSLSIVVPALNEEEAIGSTIERCLASRDEIRKEGGVEGVEIIVVSDGSTDRTEEIATSYPEVRVLAFDQNQGYGAAIKCGFEHGQGELVGFLDADGTCEPHFFGTLCRTLSEQKADVALGSRMGPGSRMPFLRSFGNMIYAWILGFLSRQSVGDTASGMRVIRRDSLPNLYPLPDGLHFTPAMSARVLLEGRLKLVEIPMPYAERFGRSKLSVLRDGLRFLKVIVEAAVCYRPARPLFIVAAVQGVAGTAILFGPALFFVEQGRLEEWMIYRVLLGSLLATTIALVLCSAVVAEHISATAFRRPPAPTGLTAALNRLFTAGPRWAGLFVCLVGAVLLAWPGIVEYSSTGHVTMHWSRAVLSSLLLALAGMLRLTTFLLNMTRLIRRHHDSSAGVPTPDRVR